MNYYFKFFLKLILEIIPNEVIKENSYFLYKDRSTLHRFLDNVKNLTKFRKLFNHFRGFQMSSNLLEDSYSKNMLIRIMVAHIYGFNNTFVSPKVYEFWNKIRVDFFLKLKQEKETLISGRYNLQLYNLNKIGIPVKLFNNDVIISYIFLLQQYKYDHKKVIEACEGDVVLDGGGCFGETALYFATKVKELGRVYTFEFINSNIKTLRKNLSLNPKLEQIIELIEIPLWSKSDQNMYILEDGTGSKIEFQPSRRSSKTIKTISIDDFVKRNNIQKVNFIKMDIEGAELEVLLGAKETLARFNPKLAISVYHDLEHYYKIPQFINSLNLNYKFYLNHYSIRRAESILFAVVE